MVQVCICRRVATLWCWFVRAISVGSASIGVMGCGYRDNTGFSPFDELFFGRGVMGHPTLVDG
jgi:hypothetical protein